jgi:hypothetical protein
MLECRSANRRKRESAAVPLVAQQTNISARPLHNWSEGRVDCSAALSGRTPLQSRCIGERLSADGPRPRLLRS